MKKILTRLQEKKGDMTILAAGVFLVLMLCIGAALEISRIWIVEKGANDAVRNSVVLASHQNEDSLYESEKDMYTASYSFDSSGGTWNAHAETSAIEDCLKNHLQLVDDGTGWVKKDSAGHEQYRVTNLAVSVGNPSLAPSGDPESLQSFTITVNFTLEVPINFTGAGTVSTPMQVKSTIGRKF